MDCIRFDIASFSCYGFSSWCKNTSGGIATICFFLLKVTVCLPFTAAQIITLTAFFFCELIGVLFYATTHENVFRTWAKCIL